MKDRTFLAVRRQLNALRATTYEIGIRNAETGAMRIMNWSAQEVEKAVSFLKARNRAECDIYIRPANTTDQQSQGVILLDDVTRGAIKRMKEQGHEPAAEIETSPDNFQVWIRVSETPIPRTQATAISKYLAKIYEADPNSADFRHFGRLAGFTNRKPIYRAKTNKAPFVLAHSCKGKRCSKAENLLAIQVKKSSPQNMEKLSENTQNEIASQTARQFYLDQLAFYEGRYGTALDMSRADWSIVGKMINKGFGAGEIMATLDAESPQINDRKRGHVWDYIERTVTKRINLTTKDRE